MSKVQGKKGTKPATKPVAGPADEDEQKATPTELTEADLEKVSGGAYEFYVAVKGTKQGK